MDFTPDRAYLIETLPDDLYDDVPAGQRWATKDALFWNDCEGWWIQSISDYWLANNGDHPARYWRPLPEAPMTRDEILSERGMRVCTTCDWAVKINEPHDCKGSSLKPHKHQ